MTVGDQFAPFAVKMRQAGLPELVIHVFEHYYHQLQAGVTGFIPNDQALPVDNIPDYEELGEQHKALGYEALDRTVVLKLNGGLGTSMGMKGPKSLLEVKDGHSFLDIIIQQILYLRQHADARLPLVLMNSFSTHQDTQTALTKYPELKQGLPLTFLQHKVPKIDQVTMGTVDWPDDPDKEWCPPGHGDIYAALLTSGTLDKLLDGGYEYAFVSNSDNLGAVMDLGILGYMVAERLPFLMEVAYRTLADSKGGHLARRPDGQLILRELAQCPANELEQFQDVDHYRFFNTNNLWIHLPSLHRIIREQEGVLGLPMIRNKKTVDAAKPDSPSVFQLETAMGSAIAVFPLAQAMRVPRARFVPVKRSNDLLLLWSDVYRLSEEHHIELAPDRHVGPARRPPLVFLDNRYYQLIDDLRRRFPHGAPSLRQCLELRLEGDIIFGKDVILEGNVHIINRSDGPLHIQDDTRIG